MVGTHAYQSVCRPSAVLRSKAASEHAAPRVTEQGLFDDALGLFSPDDTSEIADLLSLA